MNHTENYLEVTRDASHSAYLAYRDFWRTVRQSPEWQVVPSLYRGWTPGLLLLGGFGNVATIFVLRRIKDSNSSQHVFLIALAVVDLFYLCSTMLPLFVYYYFRVDVEAVHTATCKLFTWMNDVSSTLSAWLVTAVTVQRTLAVTWPHKIRVMCTVRTTWIVVATLVFTACALRSSILVMFRVQKNRCSYHETARYIFFLQYIRIWLNMSLKSFLPFACLLVCDVILSLSLFQATSASSVANQAVSSAPSARRVNSRRETARKTTVMILALSITFLILTLPIQIVLVWHNVVLEGEYGPELYIMYNLMHHVTFLLMSTNSAVNFFLYCFTGTRFRKEFLSWICCSATGHSSRSVWRTTSGSATGERSKQHNSAQESRLTRN